MGVSKKRMYCPEERSMVLAERQTPNHVLHLLLSVVTAGFWLPVWLLAAIWAAGPYRCPRCGEKTLWRAPKEHRKEGLKA
jgi:hypothetical protein